MSSSVQQVAAPRGGILGLSWRQITALIALVNAFVASYLHLWKIGKAGTLSCGGSGGCALVQFSQWSWFFGVDVALIGAIGYSLILIVAVVGAAERFASARWPAYLLAALVYPALAFTLRLKWAEFYMLRTFCPWCAISAVSITLLALITWAELRRVRRTNAA